MKIGFLLLLGLLGALFDATYAVHTLDHNVFVDATRYHVTVKVCRDGYEPYYTGFNPSQHGRDAVLHVACAREVEDNVDHWDFQDITLK